MGAVSNAVGLVVANGICLTGAISPCQLEPVNIVTGNAQRGGGSAHLDISSAHPSTRSNRQAPLNACRGIVLIGEQGSTVQPRCATVRPNDLLGVTAAQSKNFQCPRHRRSNPHRLKTFVGSEVHLWAFAVLGRCGSQCVTQPHVAQRTVA